MERSWEALVEYGQSNKDNAYTNLTENIDCLFDYDKREALDLDREKVRKLTAHANPG